MNENELRILKAMVAKHEERLSLLEKQLVQPKSLNVVTTYADSWKNLSTKIGAPEEKIKEVFHLEGEQLVVTKVEAKDDKEKTQNICLLALLGYKYLLLKDEVKTGELRRNVAENGVRLENFATYLGELIPSKIYRKGKPKSNQLSYKLVLSGEVYAKGLLKSLISK